MGIYERIFIDNYRNSNIYISPSREKSANFISALQIGQFFLLFAPFDFFRLLHSPAQDYAAACAIVVIFTGFNLLYFNKTRFNALLNEYENMSDQKRKQIGRLSFLISAVTLLGNLGIFAYKLYHY